MSLCIISGLFIGLDVGQRISEQKHKEPISLYESIEDVCIDGTLQSRKVLLLNGHVGFELYCTPKN